MTRLAISKSNAFTFIPGFTSSMYLSCPKSDSAAASRMMSSSSGYFTCRMSIRNGVTSSNSSPAGAGTHSGWSKWESSSTPSISRGPGREKLEAASTAKTRPAPSESIRSQKATACACASGA